MKLNEIFINYYEYLWFIFCERYGWCFFNCFNVIVILGFLFFLVIFFLLFIIRYIGILVFLFGFKNDNL